MRTTPPPQTGRFRYASHWWKHDDSFPEGQEDWGYILVARHGRLLRLDRYGHLYPADIDLWVDRLDVAAGEAGAARIRPDDEDDDPDAGVSAR
jgi:hypothetical protein